MCLLLHNTVPPFQKFPILVQASEEAVQAAAAAAAPGGSGAGGPGEAGASSREHLAHLEMQGKEEGARLFIGEYQIRVARTARLYAAGTVWI